MVKCQIDKEIFTVAQDTLLFGFETEAMSGKSTILIGTFSGVGNMNISTVAISKWIEQLPVFINKNLISSILFFN